MRILRVNMTKLETVFEDLPPDWVIIGGRGLCDRILKAEVPPQSDPLGPEAKLIIATGPLAGTLAPSCGRISVGAKSPLTLGIKEANSGGPVGQKMDKLGIRAIIVEGSPSKDKIYLLRISEDGAVIEPADQYKGLKNYNLVEALYEKFDKKSAIISIGIGGERLWKSASVGFTDTEGHPSRHAARGGLGAVMGAKGIKAIVIDDQGTAAVDIVSKESFRETIKNWAEVLKADPQAQGMMKYGTPAGIVPLRSIGSAPSKNYSSEQTEGFENLAGPAFEKVNQERGGGLKGCMPGCLIRCSTSYYGPDGKYLTSGFEYETLALLGTNLGLSDPDIVAKLDRLCDDQGLDTIEIGSALGVAASAGKMIFGDAGSVLALFDELEKGSEFGNILGNGVVSTCKALGVTRIPAYKGQAIPAHDPRVTKAAGVTYTTSPFGLGLEIEDLVQIGRETLKAELEFNRGSEFHTAHDPDPEFLRTEHSAPIGNVFDVDPGEIGAIWGKLDSTVPY